MHVGIAGPKYALRDLTPEEKADLADSGYVKYEQYPESESPDVGRYWSQFDLDRVGKGCRTVTRMSRLIAETYAREPGFYGATMCVGCRKHLPVGADGEFVWVDRNGEATGERVGT